MRPNDLATVSSLRKRGFDGFLAFADLDRANRNSIPAEPGVYLVLRTCTSRPRFLGKGTGGHFKNRDPNVSIAALEKEWVDGALIVYVGQTGSRSQATLRKRLSDLTRFGQEERPPHWGGRYIWQLADASDLLVCWMETSVDPREVEKHCIETFKSAHAGRRPFANLRD